MASTGRRCSVCSLPHSRLLELERAIGGKTLSVSQISRVYEVSTDSIYRHIRTHEPLEARAETPESAAPIVVADLVERLVEVADDARRARHLASLNNHALSLSRAAEAEMRAVGMLLDRLGIDNTETAEALRNADAMRLAVARAILREPDVGRSIAAAYRRDQRDDEADEFEGFALRAEARLRENAIVSEGNKK